MLKRKKNYNSCFNYFIAAICWPSLCIFSDVIFNEFFYCSIICGTYRYFLFIIHALSCCLSKIYKVQTNDKFDTKANVISLIIEKNNIKEEGIKNNNPIFVDEWKEYIQHGDILLLGTQSPKKIEDIIFEFYTKSNISHCMIALRLNETTLEYDKNGKIKLYFINIDKKNNGLCIKTMDEILKSEFNKENSWLFWLPMNNESRTSLILSSKRIANYLWSIHYTQTITPWSEYEQTKHYDVASVFRLCYISLCCCCFSKPIKGFIYKRNNDFYITRSQFIFDILKIANIIDQKTDTAMTTPEQLSWYKNIYYDKYFSIYTRQMDEVQYLRRFGSILYKDILKRKINHFEIDPLSIKIMAENFVTNTMPNNTILEVNNNVNTQNISIDIPVYNVETIQNV